MYADTFRRTFLLVESLKLKKHDHKNKKISKGFGWLILKYFYAFSSRNKTKIGDFSRYRPPDIEKY